MGHDAKRVRSIRPDDRSEGKATSGMHRQRAASTDRSLAGPVTTEPATLSGWHHHGEYDSHIFVLSGALQMESKAGDGRLSTRSRVISSS